MTTLMGKTVLITGANRGIGRALMYEALRRGADRVYADTRGPAAFDDERSTPLLVDVTDPDQVAYAVGGLPALDLLVNNAGIAVPLDPPAEATLADFRRTYETNVFGVVAVTNAFLPALRRSARPRIVNVSSGTASLTWSTGPNPQFTPGNGYGAAYRSAKSALNALTVFYAQTLGAPFKVNALAPGARATDLNPRARAVGGDPEEGARGAVRLALLPDDGPTGGFFSWDGTSVPW